MESNSDWNKLIGSIAYHTLSLSGWPTWDKAENKEPYFVNLTYIMGEGLQSRDMAIKFDDMADGNFWYRDFTEDAMPFVDKGEKYKSIFVFQKKKDYEDFKEFFGC